jgi:hypothetical protein
MVHKLIIAHFNLSYIMKIQLLIIDFKRQPTRTFGKAGLLQSDIGHAGQHPVDVDQLHGVSPVLSSHSISTGPVLHRMWYRKYILTHVEFKFCVRNK